jgi:glucose-6-phosphate isomerase
MTAKRVEPAQPLTERPAWKALQEHYRTVRDLHLRQVFADDPTRGTRLTAEAVGLYLDYSKHRVTDETLRLLVRLADDRGLADRIEAMFSGRKINVTEQRAVLHVALRAPVGSIAWRLSPMTSAAGAGRVTRDGPFATSSISASAAPISDR